MPGALTGIRLGIVRESWCTRRAAPTAGDA